MCMCSFATICCDHFLTDFCIYQCKVRRRGCGTHKYPFPEDDITDVAFCRVVSNALPVATVAKGKDRDIVLEALSHAESCTRCYKVVFTLGFKTAAEFRKFLVKVWKQ